jgi:hypothetical protein
MGASGSYRRTLDVNLCEIERGVFYATYRHDDPATDLDELPTYQVGQSAADAKQRIELRALALGYDVIVWKESILVPVFPVHDETALRGPATA